MKIQYAFMLLVAAGSLVAGFRPGQNSSLAGTWRVQEPSGATVMLTIADGYLVQTTYASSRFIATKGGPYEQKGDQLNLLSEFDTADSSRVSQSDQYRVSLRGGQLTLTSPVGNQTFERVDESPTSLTGLWRITGRADKAGQVTPMQRGPRKTLKLLTGSRFQWIAINPQTKQFFGTGGGIYTLKDGHYTETIDFFSRDNSRVGRSLTFDATVNQDEWHHTGQSSTGGAVDEIWSREK